METNNDEALNSLLSEVTPEEQAKTDAKMLLAEKIADAMQAKGWTKKRLMQETGKTNQSEITRWLSGTQNFTVDTLVDLERVLDIKLLHWTDEKTMQQSGIEYLLTSFSVQNEITTEIESYQKEIEELKRTIQIKEQKIKDLIAKVRGGDEESKVVVEKLMTAEPGVEYGEKNVGPRPKGE